MRENIQRNVNCKHQMYFRVLLRVMLKMHKHGLSLMNTKVVDCFSGTSNDPQNLYYL